MKPKKWLAVSCSHGHLINRDAAESVLKFKHEYKPHTILHLGDFIDADAFRAGALRSGEGSDIIGDLVYGLEFLQRLEPTTVFQGNHEDRLYRLQAESKSELVQFAVGEVIGKIDAMIYSLKADYVPYAGMSNPASYRELGGTLFTHGYAFGMMAPRDHVESTGKPIVMGHIHKLTMQPGRLPGAPLGFAVGCLCDIPAMQYAKNRRETATWEHGFAYGEYGDDWCTVNLQRINKWQPAKYKPAK
jgi:hypothetical protein